MPHDTHPLIATADARIMEALGRRQLCVRCIAHDAGLASPDVADDLTSLGRTVALNSRIATCVGCLKETVDRLA